MDVVETVAVDVSKVGVATEESIKLAETTWAQVGLTVQPLGRMVFVRTLPVEDKVGSLYLPPKEAGYMGGMAHQKTLKGIILAAGPKSQVQVGERVCFTRLYFAWWKKLGGGALVGWIDAAQLTGYCEG